MLSKLNIDAVFGGHDHIYSRTHLLANGHAVGDLSAPNTLAKFPGEVLWFTLNSGSGSKYYNEMPMTFPFNAVSHQAYKPSYTHLSVTEDALRVVTHVNDGTLSDDVTLTRAPAGAIPNLVPPGEPVVDFWGDGSTPFLGDAPVANVTDPETGITTVEARILRGNDDVEEYVLDKEMYLDSSDLEIVEERPTSDTDKEAQIIGLRFDRVQIPARAQIQSAHIQFTVDEPKKSVGPASAVIAIEDTDHAAGYTNAAGDVSDRTFRTDTVAWTNIPEWPEAQVAGPDQRTPDLSALVQAIVDRDDWFSNNALSFAITGSGARTAEAYEGAKKDPAEMPTSSIASPARWTTVPPTWRSRGRTRRPTRSSACATRTCGFRRARRSSRRTSSSRPTRSRRPRTSTPSWSRSRPRTSTTPHPSVRPTST